jgi:branched-chain amino acid transport system substrate-binding protein
MMQRSWFFARVAAVVTLAGVVACGDVKTNDQACAVVEQGDYYIASLLPFTGELETYGQPDQNEIVQAIDEINSAGGVHGKRLGLITCDDHSDAIDVKEAATELAAVTSLPAIIGPITSANTIAVTPIFKEAEKVVMSPDATSPLLSTLDDGGFVFRAAPSDAYQGRVAAGLAKRQGFAKVFVINVDDAYGNSLAGEFIANFDDATHASELANPFVEGAPRAAALINAARAYAPDAVFFAGYTSDAAAIIQAAVSQGFQPHWILTDGSKDPSLFTLVNNNAYLEGVIGLGAASNTFSDAYKQFTERYRALWGDDPLDANSYDSTYIVAMAMELANDASSGDEVRVAMQQTHSGSKIPPNDWAAFLAAKGAGSVDYVGLSGPLDFDVNGDVLADYTEWIIEGGDIVDKACWTFDMQPCVAVGD